MGLTVLHSATAAAVYAAADQEAQLAAMVAPWAGGELVLRYYSAADVLLDTVVHGAGAWAIDYGTTPRQAAVVSAITSRTFAAAGTASYVVAAVPAGADILRADVTMGAAVSSAARTSLAVQAGAAGLVVLANGSLSAPPFPSWIASATVGQWAQIIGTTAPSGVGANFSGVAWRDEPGVTEVLSALPGGHASGTFVSSNPVYSIRLSDDTPAWVTRRAASDTTGWSPTPATTEYFPSDSRPIPRHTYSCCWWVPERASYVFGGTYAGTNGDVGIIEHREFKLTEDGGSDDWTARATLPNKAAYHNIIAARNSLTGEFFVGIAAGGSGAGYQKWNPTIATPTWTAITPTGATSFPGYNFTFDSRRNCVTSIGYYGGSERAVRMDWSSLAKTAITFNTSAGQADYQTYLTAMYHASIDYSPNDDAYYIYNGNGGPSSHADLAGRVYKVYPSDAAEAWDIALLPIGGSPPTTNVPAGSDGRFKIIDSLRAGVTINPGAVVNYYKLPFASQIAVRSGSVTGTLPYTATVLPLRGEVPAGSTVTSADDTTMRATVLSTHDDGSAAVVVLAGETTVTADTTKRLAVSIAASSADTALTSSRIDALVTSVVVDFAGTYGSATISDFTMPELVWWANSRVICARYRLAAPTPGSTELEAVIDITAYPTGHDRALVEVVIENGTFDALTSTGSTKPADADYTGATVTINGTLAATADSTSAPTGTHQPFRAWYAKAWVGGDPEIRATPRHIDLQRHPLFWRCDKVATTNFATYTGTDGSTDTYSDDAYTPWSTGRHRADNMGAGGSHDSIGPLPAWEAHALQSGDYRCWNAAEQNALAVLTYNVNYRDTTGLVPDSARMPDKYQNDTVPTWPRSIDSSGSRGIWERAHQPAAGLMAFVARPSPVFIEIAQKIAVTSGTIIGGPAYRALFDAAGVGLDSDLTGISVPNQTRSLAWGARQTAHATFLSPDGSTWRTGGKVWMGRIARMARAYQLLPEAQSLRMWDSLPSVANGFDQGTGTVGVDQDAWAGKQASFFMWTYLLTELHKAAGARLCATETEQGYLDAFADWALECPAKWINDQPSGAWRFLPYHPTYLKDDDTAFTDYAEQKANDVPTGSGPASATGSWMPDHGFYSERTWTAQEALTAETTSGNTYPSYFWMALVMAVERGVPGAAEAWAAVDAGITDLATWRAGFAANPRWGPYPRANV